MISRLSTFAAIFAVIATASLAFAASSRGDGRATSAATTQMRVMQLEPVVIVAKRRPH